MGIKKEIILSEKIFNNPLTKNIIAIYNQVIPFGEVVTTNIEIMIDNFTKKKHQEFLETILSDNNLIVSADVNDIEFIMNFKRTLDAVNRLANNDKVVYFANLLKNGYMKENKISNDEYEENLRILGELSFRELNYLFFLYRFEQNNDINQKHYWYKFIEEFEKEFKINKYKSYEIYKRIANLGLISEELELETKSVIEKSDPQEYDELMSGNLDLKYFYTTDFLRKFISLVKKDNF